MDQNEKASSAWRAPEAKDKDDDGLVRHSHCSANANWKQTERQAPRVHANLLEALP
jgi:hypothetical protein